MMALQLGVSLTGQSGGATPPIVVSSGAMNVAAAGTVTITNAIDDIILVFQNRVGSGVPTIVSGFTNLGTGTDGTTAASCRLAWRRATAANETLTTPAAMARPVYLVIRSTAANPFPNTPLFTVAASATTHTAPANTHGGPLLWLSGVFSSGTPATRDANAAEIIRTGGNNTSIGAIASGGFGTAAAANAWTAAAATAGVTFTIGVA